MADILTLVDARKALRLGAADTSNDDDLTATYVPAVTAVVEDLCGPVMRASGRVATFNGGRASVLLPSACKSVESVTEDGVALLPDVDFTVNPVAGIVYRGATPCAGVFAYGLQNVVVTYTAGAYATSVDVPAHIKLAARIILRQMWQSDQQGYRPAFGAPDTDTVTTPSGFAVPKRAVELLRPNPNVPGIA